MHDTMEGREGKREWKQRGEQLLATWIGLVGLWYALIKRQPSQAPQGCNHRLLNFSFIFYANKKTPLPPPPFPGSISTLFGKNLFLWHNALSA